MKLKISAIKSYTHQLLIIVLLGCCTSCFKDTPLDKLSQESIWGSPLLLDEYVLPWYRNMSSGFDVYMPTSSLIKRAGRIYMPWYGDQINVSRSDWYATFYGDILKGDQTEISAWAAMTWSRYYTQIQSCNLLLQEQDKIADGEHKQRLLGEAKFFRAYYYYLLLRQHGAPMLIERTYDPLNDPVTFPRASYDEMVRFISSEASEAATLLASVSDKLVDGRVTQGAALMLKAKVYFWATNDYLQNASKDYLGFGGNRKIEMLGKAQQAYDELMELKHYSLLPVTGTTQEEVAKSYRKIFLTRNSVESILEVQHSADGNYDIGYGHKLDRDASSPFWGGTSAAYTPTQNHVNEYGMQNMGDIVDENNPYAGREYRFYANVLYDGCTFRGRTMEINYKKSGNSTVPSADLTPYGESTSAAVTKTGYYLGKFVNESTPIDNDMVYASNQTYIIWRYAEVLLDYAEIAYQLGDPQTALDRVNEVRNRAHAYPLSAITLDDIKHERRVEMAFEETTYWDMFRWGVAEEKMNGSSNPLLGMTITMADDGTKIYKTIKINKYPSRVRNFNKKQYYLPIDWNDMRYHDLEQNPDWVEL